MRSVSTTTLTFVELRSTFRMRSSTAMSVSSHIRLVVDTAEKTMAPAPTVSWR